jgi:AraC-like DNA-binding protein
VKANATYHRIMGALHPGFDWKSGWVRPPGLEDVGITCSTLRSEMSMVSECCCLCWQTLGTRRLEIAGARHELRAGDALLVAPRTALVLAEADPAARFLAVLVSRSVVTSALIERSGGAVTAIPDLPAPLSGPELDAAWLGFYHAITGFDVRARARPAWFALLGALVFAALERQAEPHQRPPLVRRACDYLHDRPGELVTLDQVAGAVGVSKYHLARLFRRAVGMTVQRYHRCLRAEQARLLIDRGSSPSLAGAAAGFFDQSHFSRVFKQTFGVSPGTYADTSTSRSQKDAPAAGIRRRPPDTSHAARATGAPG